MSAGAPSGAHTVRPADISAVVQGPIVGAPEDAPARRLTARCVESIRRHLPGAELVLSTWRGSDVRGLSFDRLVESDDPGTAYCDDPATFPGTGRMPWNVNRHLVSARNGVRTATRPYVMKIRSDMLLTGTRFLEFVGRYPARSPEWRVLRERVLTPTYYARNPHSARKYAFHPSDWWHFGLREDVLNLWELPLAGPELARWYETRPAPATQTEPWLLYRYTGEQYFWLQFLRKHGDVPFEHKTDWTRGAIALSELTLANNLVMAELTQLDLAFPKYPMPLLEWYTCYTHGDWERLYQRYCDPAFRPAPDLLRARKRAYAAVIAPAHGVLASPRSSRRLGSLTRAWAERFPGSFRAAKRVVVSGLHAIDRWSGS